MSLFRRSLLSLLCVVCVLGSRTCFGEPLFRSTQLFTPTDTNYYHIPGLVVTARGTVLAYAAWRHVGITDWGDIHTVLRRSTDGGKTWGPEQQIAPLGAPLEAIVRSSP